MRRFLESQLSSWMTKNANDYVIDVVASGWSRSRSRYWSVIVNATSGSSFVVATCDDDDAAEMVAHALRVMVGHTEATR
jgi:hypothetical protein